MNQVTLNQIAGVIRALLPTVVMIAVAAGLLTQEASEKLTPEFQRLVELLFGTSGVGSVIVAIWSLWSNRASAVVKQAASTEGVIVKVDQMAPSGIQALAANPRELDVVPLDYGNELPPRSDAPDAPMGLVSAPRRDYRGVSFPYTLSFWKLNIAMGYVRPHWNALPTRVANKIAAAYNARRDLVLDQGDFDALPEDLWLQVRGWL